MIPVITIDGPGGSGKGTVALQLARYLGWHYLDSGALYRLVAVTAMNRGIEATDEDALGRLALDLDATFVMREGVAITLLDGHPIDTELRTEEVSALASRVAAIPPVRDALVGRQRLFREAPGLVADGRDMGTVIFPQAELKIFLSASAKERAGRRYKQLKDKGENVTLSRLFRDIEERDERDRLRPVAPLRPAKDAHIIDSTELSIDQVLQKIIALVEKNQVVKESFTSN